MSALFIALMSIPLVFVLCFWVLISYENLRNRQTRWEAVAFLTIITFIEVGIWTWVVVGE